tara:strand:- start:764 stop:1342 length:579 start_codon:yes stop_codon:yes gene_type:complete
MGRDPFSNKNIYEHYLSKVSQVEPWVLKKSVDELLATCQSLPKINQLLMTISKYTPKMNTGSVSCDKCGTQGLIFSVIINKPDGGSMELPSYNHKAIAGAVYKEVIIGRCHCQNGLAYALSSDVVLSKKVEPPRFLYEKAKENGWDASFEAYATSMRYNKEASQRKVEDTPLKSGLNRVISTIDPEQEDIPF